MPLWLAVALRRRQKCRVIAPEWLTLDRLAAVFDRERKDITAFEGMPFHYMEVASQLMDVAGDDIPDLGRIRTVLEDIVGIRYNKVRAGINSQEASVPAYIRLNNLSAMEINSIRPFFLQSLNQVYKMHAISTRTDAPSGGDVAAEPAADDGLAPGTSWADTVFDDDDAAATAPSQDRAGGAPRRQLVRD